MHLYEKNLSLPLSNGKKCQTKKTGMNESKEDKKKQRQTITS